MRYHQPDFGGWNLWEDGVSVTSLLSSIACFEQFRLGHCLKWQPKVLPIGPAYGRLIHHLLEKTQTLGKRFKPPDRKGIEDIAKAWQKAEAKNYIGSKRREQLAHIVDIATAVFIGYAMRYRGDWLGRSMARDSTGMHPSKWLAFEESFSLPYTYADGMCVEIRGRWDALCQYQQAAWVFETKCWAVIKPEAIVPMLAWDFQFNLYLYATMQLLKKKELGGLILNVVRRPGHSPHVNESRKDFWKRLVKEVSSPAKWDHYFQRFSYDATETEIQRWAALQLYPAMEMLRVWYEGRIPHFVRSTSLVSQYGPCFLFDPIVNDDYSNFSQRRTRGKKQTRTRKG